MSRRSSESGTESGGVETAGHSAEQHSRYLLPDRLRHVCRNSHGRYSAVLSSVLTGNVLGARGLTREDDKTSQPGERNPVTPSLRVDPTCYEHMPYLTQKAKGVRCRWGGGAKYGGATDHHRRATRTPEEAETRARFLVCNERRRRKAENYSLDSTVSRMVSREHAREGLTTRLTSDPPPVHVTSGTGGALPLAVKGALQP